MNQTSVEKRISRLVRELGELLPERGETLALAESCTGGWVGQAITSRPGSSRWFSAGFVTYSNDAKQRLLGVRSRTLIDHGAVSAEAARQMAEGALRRAGADWSLAVTGIAGPGGGAKAKPVGTVWFAWVGSDLPSESESRRFDGDRRAVRAQSVEFALKGLLKRLTRGGGGTGIEGERC